MHGIDRESSDVWERIDGFMTLIGSVRSHPPPTCDDYRGLVVLILPAGLWSFRLTSHSKPPNPLSRVEVSPAFP